MVHRSSCWEVGETPARGVSAGIGHPVLMSQTMEDDMSVRFYDGKRRVYTIATNTIQGAIDLMNSTGIEWTRYKIY